MTSRTAKLNTWKRTAPKCAHFMGFGGTAWEAETAVFAWEGMEVRFPFRPSYWRMPGREDPFESVEREYGCLSGDGWETLFDQYAGTGLEDTMCADCRAEMEAHNGD